MAKGAAVFHTPVRRSIHATPATTVTGSAKNEQVGSLIHSLILNDSTEKEKLTTHCPVCVLRNRTVTPAESIRHKIGEAKNQFSTSGIFSKNFWNIGELSILWIFRIAQEHRSEKCMPIHEQKMHVMIRVLGANWHLLCLPLNDTVKFSQRLKCKASCWSLPFEMRNYSTSLEYREQNCIHL